MQDPALATRLREAITSTNLPRAYYDHPVVANHGDESVLPIAIYMDGLPYSLTDSVVGVWVANLVTHRRHLIALVRRRLTCKCGCRGWDTFFTIHMFLKWSLQALSDCIWPSERHGRTAFVNAEDVRRADLAGQPMRFKAACIQLRGDWVEFCERYGFPAHNSSTRPCFCCNAFGGGMYDPRGLSLLSSPWHMNSDRDFEDACGRCEQWVTIKTEAQKRDVCNLLHYVKQNNTIGGRMLFRDYPALHLRKGDRLEPSETLPDVANLDNCVVPAAGLSVLFWRPAMVSHRRDQSASTSYTPCSWGPCKIGAVASCGSYFLPRSGGHKNAPRRNN